MPQNMQDIDNTKDLLASLGGENVVASVRGMAKQISTSLEGALGVQFPSPYKRVKNIVYCGMGGSRFPGLIVYHLYKQQFRVPFEMCDDYLLPGSVGEDTLVVLSSYSGTTDEVLHCAKEAKSRSALITGFCGGGPLSEWFRAEGLPHYVFDETHNPSRQPRMGFGYTLGSFLGILLGLSLLRSGAEGELLREIKLGIETIPALTNMFDVDLPKAQNPAKKLALDIQGQYPYYIVAEHLTGAGNCIQNQTNETAKNISSFRVLPELNHHLMEGLMFPAVHRDTALFITFYSTLYSPKVQKRLEITEDVIRQNKIRVVRYTLESTTKLGQVFEVVLLSSFVTMYLAAIYGTNPEEVPYVDYFKAQLKKEMVS